MDRRLAVGGASAVGVLALGVALAASLGGGRTAGLPAEPAGIPAAAATPGSTYPSAAGPDCAKAPAGGDPSGAAGEIQDLGWADEATFARSYTGLRMSGPGIAVYRVPDPELDRAVRRIADAYGVCVDLVAAPISRRRMKQLGAAVESRRALLRTAGAPLSSVAYEHFGHLEVGVTGDVAAARRVLADLDHVTVRHSDVGRM